MNTHMLSRLSMTPNMSTRMCGTQSRTFGGAAGSNAAATVPIHHAVLSATLGWLRNTTAPSTNMIASAEANVT